MFLYIIIFSYKPGSKPVKQQQSKDQRMVDIWSFKGQKSFDSTLLVALHHTELPSISLVSINVNHSQQV